jgi:3-methyladenine DNA glycosylase AlkD
METILNTIREELINNIDEKTRANSMALFKEKIKYHGVKVAFVTKLSKELFKLIDSRAKSEIFDICDKLWQTGYIEESFIACNWAYYLHKRYEPVDF